jgi:hypothetical protein
MVARTAPYWPKTIGTGDGTETEFTLGFPFLHSDHLRVFVNGVLKTIVTDYTVVDPTSPEQAKIKFNAAPTAAYAIKVTRNTPVARYKSNPQIGDQAAMQALYRMQEDADKRVVLKDSFGQTALLAGTALSFVAPCDGFIEKLKGKVLKAVTTGGAVTVEIDTVAVTGLTFTVADADAAGTTYSDVPTTAQSATTKVKKGQTITITPAAAFATAGDLEVELEIQPGDLT